MGKHLVSPIFCITFTSCYEAGTASTSLQGTEANLPEELKGLKIYTVSTGKLSSVQVGILDDTRTTSTTYPVGKSKQTFILVEKNTGRTIEVNEIISENDSIIVCKK